MEENYNNNPLGAKERIKKDFSVVQVIASALSAVTSVILAPRIGIIGGILGVAIGAAVAAIVSQVYKSVLNASAEKLRLKQEQAWADQQSFDLNKTTVNNAYNQNPYTKQAGLTEKHSVSGSRIAPLEFRLQAAHEQKHTLVKRLAIVVVITLISVGLSAAAIMGLTKGEGLGQKPEPIYIISHQPTSSQDTKPSGQTDSASDQKQPEQNQKPDDSTADSEDKKPNEDKKEDESEDITQPKPNKPADDIEADNTKPQEPQDNTHPDAGNKKPDTGQEHKPGTGNDTGTIEEGTNSKD